MTPSEFKAMWKRDLAQAGLKQKDVVDQMLMRHTQVTPSAVSQWVKQGYPPRGRVEMLVEILGPRSEFAQVPMATWEKLWAGDTIKAMLESNGSLRDDLKLPVREWKRNTPSLGVHFARKVENLTSAAHKRHRPLYQLVREAASEELWADFHPPLERDRRHIPGYQRNHIVAEFVYARPGDYSRQPLQLAAYKLAVMRQRYNSEGHRSHLLVAVYADAVVQSPRADENTQSSLHRRYFDEDMREEVLATIEEDARELGVHLVCVDSPEMAAKYLYECAFGSINEEPDELGIDDLDPEDEI